MSYRAPQNWGRGSGELNMVLLELKQPTVKGELRSAKKNDKVLRDLYYFTILHYFTIFGHCLILYPLKTPENVWFSGVFRGYEIETLSRKGLRKSLNNLTTYLTYFIKSMKIESSWICDMWRFYFSTRTSTSAVGPRCLKFYQSRISV